MTIAETREKCKTLAAKVPRDTLIIGVLILASSASFGLGYSAGMDAGQGNATAAAESLAEPLSAPARQVVASKNGTRYYLPECTGASRISEGNKVWFASPAAAESAGYTPAANCTGI